jgi:hypothetical protein
MIMHYLKSPGGLLAAKETMYHKVYGGYPEAVNVKDIDTMQDFIIQKGDVWSHEKEGDTWLGRESAWLTDKNGTKVKSNLGATNIADWLYSNKSPKGVSIKRHGENRDRVTIQAKDGSEYEMGYAAYLESLK